MHGGYIPYSITAIKIIIQYHQYIDLHRNDDSIHNYNLQHSFIIIMFLIIIIHHYLIYFYL